MSPSLVLLLPSISCPVVAPHGRQDRPQEGKVFSRGAGKQQQYLSLAKAPKRIPWSSAAAVHSSCAARTACTALGVADVGL